MLHSNETLAVALPLPYGLLRVGHFCIPNPARILPEYLWKCKALLELCCPNDMLTFG